MLSEHGAEVGHAAQRVVLGQGECRFLAETDHLNEVWKPAVAHNHLLSVLKVGSKLSVVENGQRHRQLVPRSVVHRLHAAYANQLAHLPITRKIFLKISLRGMIYYCIEKYKIKFKSNAMNFDNQVLEENREKTLRKNEI